MRPVGTALSPNELALGSRGMLSMVQLDGVQVDMDKHTITLQAGARVSQVLEELQKHGLTLENFSSIIEQQIAGWTQTSAHGRCSPSAGQRDDHQHDRRDPAQGTLKLALDGPDSDLFR